MRQENSNQYVLTLGTNEILRTHNEKKAVTRFRQLRRDMESKYPARELTQEEKAEMLRLALGDAMVGYSGLGRKKKKTTAGGTRTFGR